jgi:8-oxo-dGTP diphosphatase
VYKDIVSDCLPRVGSALIVKDEANRILLGRRAKDPQRGSWILPGGKIKAFESIAQAAERELLEETGLVVQVQRQFRVYEIVNPPAEHRIVIYSWAKVIGGTPQASDDVSELRFASLEELGQMPVTPLVHRVLQDAGLLESESIRTESSGNIQQKLFPMPVAGACGSKRARRAAGSGVGRRQRAVSAVRNYSLQFD